MLQYVIDKLTYQVYVQFFDDHDICNDDDVGNKFVFVFL